VKPDIQIRANLRPGVKDPLSVVKSFVSNNQDQWMEFCQEYNDCRLGLGLGLGLEIKQRESFELIS